MNDGHGTHPCCACVLDLYGEAAHGEACGLADGPEVGHLFHMAVAYVDAGEVRFPNESGVTRGLEVLGLEGQGAIPAPGVDPHDLHALFCEEERSFAIHAGAFDEVFRCSPGLVRSSPDEDYVQGLYTVFDAVQFRPEIAYGNVSAVGYVTEVQEHAVLHAPLEGNVVYGEGRFPLVHGGVIMVRSVKMSAAVGARMHHFQGPAQAVREIVLGNPWEERRHLRGAAGVIHILYRWNHHGRIAG